MTQPLLWRRTLDEVVRDAVASIGERPAEDVLRQALARATHPGTSDWSRKERSRWLRALPRRGWRWCWDQLRALRAVCSGLRALLARVAIQADPDRSSRSRRSRWIGWELYRLGLTKRRPTGSTDGRRPRAARTPSKPDRTLFDAPAKPADPPAPQSELSRCHAVPSLYKEYSSPESTPVEKATRAADPEKSAAVEGWFGARTFTGRARSGWIGDIARRCRLIGFEHVRDDTSRASLREVLSRGVQYWASIARSGIAVAVESLLVAAGVYDLAPRKRRALVTALCDRHGKATLGITTLVLADIERDGNVRSIGAVFLRRALTLLRAERWRDALSFGAPDQVKDVIDIHTPVPPVWLKGDGSAPVGTTPDNAVHALRAFREGASLEQIAELIGTTAEVARGAINWALRAGKLGSEE